MIKDILKDKYSEIAILMSTAIISVFVYFMFRLCINLPYGDDFPAIFDTIKRFTSISGIPDFIKLAFERYAEHEIIPCKIVSISLFALTGSINLYVLNLIGLVNLFAITIILFKSFKCNTSKVFIFLPVLMLIYNLSYSESLNWAMASLSNFPAVAFAFISIFFLNRKPEKYFNFIVALIFSSLSMYTFGNGIVSFLVGVFTIALKKDWPRLAIWLTVFIALTILYFSMPNYFATPREGLTLSIKTLINMTQFFFVFIGSVAGHKIPAFLLGFSIFSFFSFQILKKEYVHNYNIFGFFIFLIICAALTVLSRSIYGVEYALNSRYQFYSVIFLALTYILAIEYLFRKLGKIDTKRFTPIIALFSIIFILSYPFHHKMAVQRKVEKYAISYFLLKRSDLDDNTATSLLKKYNSQKEKCSNSIKNRLDTQFRYFENKYLKAQSTSPESEVFEWAYSYQAFKFSPKILNQ